MIFIAISSEKLIALNTLHDGVSSFAHFTAESTEAMQGHRILMLAGIEPSASVSRNRHSNHMTNIAPVAGLKLFFSSQLTAR